MSKDQPWKHFAIISQDTIGDWVLSVLNNKLFVRSYAGDVGETVVVIGNRRAIGDDVGEVIEAEFVFRSGELFTAHILKFNPAETAERDAQLLRVYAEHWSLDYDRLTAIDRARLRNLRAADEEWNF